jgi:hypothetical protein
MVGIILLWVFVVANNYEHSNNCIIKLDGIVIFCEDIEDMPYIHYGTTNSTFGNTYAVPLKPLILLYPNKESEVTISLDYSPGFFATFPKYDESKKWWSVIARPDATLLDDMTWQETYGLFWEGNPGNTQYNTSKWFVIAWNDIREFLYEKLTEIGLNTKEKSDFIMYWYPKLQEYPYVQITFAGEDYTSMAKLNISPKPDALLRVFMVAKPLQKYKEISPQIFEKFERKWFSVVEWGWTILE